MNAIEAHIKLLGLNNFRTLIGSPFYKGELVCKFTKGKYHALAFQMAWMETYYKWAHLTSQLQTMLARGARLNVNMGKWALNPLIHDLKVLLVEFLLLSINWEICMENFSCPR